MAAAESLLADLEEAAGEVSADVREGVLELCSTESRTVGLQAAISA